MKYFKTGIFIIALALVSNIERVNAQILTVGENDLNLAIGFAPTWIKPGYYTIIPPISVSLDHGLRDDLGKGILTVGGFIGVARYAQEKEWFNLVDRHYYTYGYKYTSTLIAARTTYHYELFSKLDTYIGLMGGFKVNTNKDYGNWPDIADVNFDTDANVVMLGRIFIGAKYNFTERIGGFGELGYGTSYVTLGVSFRI